MNQIHKNAINLQRFMRGLYVRKYIYPQINKELNEYFCIYYYTKSN